MLKIYNTGSGLVKSTSGSSLEMDELGYKGTDIPAEYLIVIDDKRPKVYTDAAGVKRRVVITAPMQEQITTRTESAWTPLAAGAYVQKAFGGLTQFVLGRTLVSKYASRRLWAGTSPLDFTLNLKFEAINDVYKEVYQPVLELQRMSLPFSGVSPDQAASEGIKDKFKNFFAKSFLAPPGPDPFDIEGLPVPDKFKSPEGISEEITVKIGSFLEIKRAVVVDITVQQHPKLDPNGVPIEAIATVHFQTFEIMTKESLDSMYKGGTFRTAAIEAQKWLE